MAFLLLIDFGVLPIRGTKFSRGISHVSALLLELNSIYPIGARLKYALLLFFCVDALPKSNPAPLSEPGILL